MFKLNYLLRRFFLHCFPPRG